MQKNIHGTSSSHSKIWMPLCQNMKYFSCPLWIGLAFSAVSSALLGLDLAYNVYAVPLKETLNFTQTEVELVSVFGLMGMGASLVEPFITARFGYAVGYFVIWVTTSGSVLLMWIAVVYKEIFSQWPSVVCVVQFLMNVGQNAGCMRLTSTSGERLSKRHTGKIVGLGLGSAAAGKLVYGGLRQVFFTKDLQGFFLTVFLCQATFLGITFLIHTPENHVHTTVSEECCMEKIPLNRRRRLLDPHKTSEASGADAKKWLGKEVTRTRSLNMADTTDKNESEPPGIASVGKIQSDPENMVSNGSTNPVTILLTSRYFHLTLWPSAVIYSVLFTLMNNITSIARSLRLGNPMYLVYVLSVTIVAGRVGFGLLFDKINSNLCRYVLLLTGAISTVVGIALMILNYTAIGFYVVTFLFGVGVSVGLTIPSSLMAVGFGPENITFILGCIYCLTSVFVLFFQFITGVFYDKILSPDGFCYGTSCFFWSSIVLLAASTLSTVVHILSFVNQQTA